LVKATFEGFKQLKTPSEIAQKRGIKVGEILRQQ
jgi:ribosomal protein S5